MAKILIVHGISNQYLGESELLSAWYDALCDGLNRVNFHPLPERADCFCPFYGNLFREEAHLGLSAPKPDVDKLNETESDLLAAIWKSATEADENVIKPEEYGETLFRFPKFAERALNALAKSSYLADYAPINFLADLKQVDAYMNDSSMRLKIRGRVTDHITDDTRIVIGHSLGSVVAYEAVCEKPAQVIGLLTLGSPLGLQKIVFKKLVPKPNALGLGRWPGNVKHWDNIAAVGDIVAAQKQLAPLFGNDLVDHVIDSGWDAHSSTRYLNSDQAGAAMAKSLAA